MGNVERCLREFELSDGTECRVELNEGRQIHIHMDNLKIQFSIAEFLEFANTTKRAEDELRRIKEI